jgi:hypothetical protein
MTNGDQMVKRRNGDQISPSGAGVAVDAFGGQVVDPTKNVLDLVRAESKYQDARRDAAEQLQNALREAESRRIDDLAALRLAYDQRIAEDLRVNVKTTSDQLAGQLVKETGSLSAQIGTLTTSLNNQITALSASFTNQLTSGINSLILRIADLERRISEIERFRWEQGGKTSVSDPATSEALSKMAIAIDKLSASNRETHGERAGGAAVWGQLAIGAGLLLSAAAIFFRHG